MNTDIEKMFKFVAQTAHFFFGSTVGLLPLAINHAVWLTYLAPAFVVITAVKEFWYDEKYETPDIRQSSLLDFAMYNLGLLGPVIYWLVNIKSL